MEEEKICPGCKHSLTNNDHGPDQNDLYEKADGKIGWDSCTYCYECNPRLREHRGGLLGKSRKV